IERFDRAFGRVDLGLAETLGGMNDLPLEVGLVDDVGVDDPEPAHPGGCEIQGSGRAETARTDEQHLRVEKLQLPLLADLGDEEVPAVPSATRCVEPALELDGKAVPFPVGEPAGERGDVLVAELTERLRGESGAVPGRAVDEDRSRRVGRRAFDARLEMASGYVDG